VEQFFDVFAAYNVAVWPAPIGAYILGLLAVALAFRNNAASGRINPSGHHLRRRVKFEFWVHQSG
jgi:hypothetical protein